METSLEKAMQEAQSEILEGSDGNYGMNSVFWCAIYIWWCFWKAKAASIFAKAAGADTIQDQTVRSKAICIFINPSNEHSR
ncbi:MAG: hypothetical protein IJ109_08480 [Firmicutes bacterium]|nr:hypothetical protein [Bacillota bacterium]